MKNIPGYIFIFLASAFVLLAGALMVFPRAFAGGVWGGFVGSSAWFTDMERSARNQAMLKSIAGTNNPQKLPPDYVEFAGRIVFPKGNPFPGGRLPDLRIACRDKSCDMVERAPHLNADGSFYTVFRRGQTYDLYWMYYFGSREKFASVRISPDGPKRRRAVFKYVYEKKVSGSENSSSVGGASQSGSSNYNLPGNISNAGSPGTSSYTGPEVGSGFKQPTVDHSWQPPKSDSGWKPPKTDSSWQPPKISHGW